jgi:hypothetical protein
MKRDIGNRTLGQAAQAPDGEFTVLMLAYSTMAWHNDGHLLLRLVARIDEVQNARCTTGPGQARHGRGPGSRQALAKRLPARRGNSASRPEWSRV